MARKERKHIVFPLYAGVSPLDLIGPLSVLRDLKLTSPYRTVVVADSIEPLVTESPLRMIPQATFGEMPAPYAVIVPGGPTVAEAMSNPALLDYLRTAGENAALVGSTGSGALLLAAAGLLEGRRAATHWAFADHLERMGVTYVADRWVEDGRFLTSAGGSAGIDMMLSLVARLKGRTTATLTQIAVEYDPHPPFGGIDWGVADRTIAGRITGPPAMANGTPGEQR